MNPWTLTLMLAAMVALSSGCAKRDWIEQTLVTVDVTGTWLRTEGAPLTLTLTQQGTRVTGTILPPGTSSTGSPIEGTVAGDVFRFTTVSGISLVGEMTVSGDEMSGHVTAVGRGGIVRLQRISAQP
jgi:hypothetical protein